MLTVGEEYPRSVNTRGVYDMDAYPFLDVVVGLEFWSERLAWSLARPQLPDDERVGDGHRDDRQEEDDGGDE